VIDDLVDTGGTAVAIREMYPKAHFRHYLRETGWSPAG
jgi:adenine/guanine phosphoribosyltransferase-like PRPP-binding protein